MNHSDWSFIVVELVLVFGGALAFGWWQLRDVAREQAKRKNLTQNKTVEDAPAPASPSTPARPNHTPGP